MVQTSPILPASLNDLSVPKPSIPSIASLQQPDRKIAVFSDFDGTIFLQDTGHVLFDNHGCGVETRKKLDHSIGRTKTFREASEEMWGSLNVTLEEGIETLKKNLIIDKDFMGFLKFTEEHNIPFSVISAGLRPLLRAALDEFLGPEESKKLMWFRTMELYLMMDPVGSQYGDMTLN